MFKIYAIIAIVGVLGIAGYGAKYYYDTTQAEIATLRDNNAKLEVAIETSEASIDALNQEAKLAKKLTIELQNKLVIAEQYGDNLRRRLREIDLVSDAIKDSEDLEGRMNNATADLWRELDKDTGGTGDRPLPNWLQRVSPGTGSKDSNTDPKDNSTNSSPAKAN